MQKAVKCPRAAVAVFSFVSAMFLLGWRPAIAQPQLNPTTARSQPISASKAPGVPNKTDFGNNRLAQLSLASDVRTRQPNRSQPEVFHQCP